MKAQVTTSETPTPTTTTEQQLENITENSEDQETEDDSYLQQLVQLQRNPVNINTVDENFLRDLRLLTPIQIINFLKYRDLLGKLIDLYELQAIPGWDIPTIKRIRPFISVLNTLAFSEDILSRFSGGDQSLLVRVTQVLEKSKGYLLDSSQAKNFYPGSPQRIFLRYKYNFKNLLQYGFIGEKDAGEEFFKGSQKKGFDFYSAHLFIRNMGIIKSLAIGDFTVNMGQGLTQWMTLAFKKGPDIMAVKRQSAVLRPYNSPGEILFHRGVGITVGKNKWQATVFGSVRQIDANLNAADSINGQDEFVSSLQTSGLHRTASELEDKRSQQQLAFGSNFSYRFNRLQIGVNAVQFNFDAPIIMANEPYNLFALNGSNFGNYSTDFSYTFKNAHFFGEAAITNKGHKAFLNGLMISVSGNVDMSMFYRNISKGYQSLYTNAFTENTFPTNEKGFYMGISIRPHSSWRMDAYADIYRFPWLRFRVNAPTEGKEYMIQLNYKPNKVLEIYTRFKAEAKPINFNFNEAVLNRVVAQPRKNWRTNFSFKINSYFTIRGRTELIWFDKKGNAAEQGFLMYGDLLFKPMLKALSGNIRLQYFETEGFNSRLYAYESDVLYGFSIPVFSGKGYRYYLNVSYDINKKLTFWGKWAQFIYLDKDEVGSGLDLINGKKRTEIKFQVFYKF
ncbi:MAG: hypothetical protein WEA59_08050 [Ferruginibacter sp.]